MLIEHAKQLFSEDGTSGSGNPSYALFERGPLRAATTFFERRFDRAADADMPGIKVWVTIDVPFFPPMAFWAIDMGDHVALVDVTIEDPQDYWSMIEDDPQD